MVILCVALHSDLMKALSGVGVGGVQNTTVHFPEIPLISCIHVFSCGTVVLINKIWAQYEFCAQIMLLVSGGLGFQWVGSRPEGLSPINK